MESPSRAADAARSAAFLQLQVIAGALAASVLVYAGFAWFITGEAVGAGYSPPGLAKPWPTILAGVGVALLFAAPVVERAIRSRGAADAYRTALIAGFALREAAAVLGLAVALTTGEVFWCWLLAAAALIGMAAAWPRRSSFERTARWAESAGSAGSAGRGGEPR